MTKVVIIGCGDIGLRVGQLWLERGAAVMGTTRSQQGALRLQQAGIAPCLVDLDTPRTDAISLAESIVYYFVPPAGGQDSDQDVRLQHFLAAVEGQPACVVYTSTTAVYGDCQGAWVSEQSPVKPDTRRGRLRLAAENAWRQWHQEHDVPLTILRVAGIYAPGRLPLSPLQAGQPVLVESEAPCSNRIHADDLVWVCYQAALKAAEYQLYNVSDGRPGSMTEYYFAVADLLGWPRPPTVTWQQAQQLLSPQRLEFLRASRRIDNRHMLEGLAIELRYPDLQSGLLNCVEELA